MSFTRYIYLVAVAVIIPMTAFAQQVPYGINYQAVARDQTGAELANRTIDIRFSVYSGTAFGVLEYQEIHSDVPTNRYGVFTTTIGLGTPVAGEHELFSDIRWDIDNHFLMVEVKFTNDFIEMGRMQFLSVPYALYAARSLEPGPAGPEGPPGDPASDNQRLSFDGVNLTIDDGETNPTTISTVNLGVLANNPEDEIQYLSIKGDSLSITKGNSIKLQDINIDDADADPANEIQDLRLTGNELKVTKYAEATPIDLTKYIQDLTLTGNILKVTNNTSATSIDLGYLGDDADANPTNELITGFTMEGNELVIDEGGTERRVDLASNMVAFRARRIVPVSAPIATDITFTPGVVEYNDYNAFNAANGEFTAPFDGIYIFNATFTADGTGGGRSVSIFLNSSLYEPLATEISPGAIILVKSLTMKLNQGDIVKLVINTGLSTLSGTGSFSGYKVF